MDTVAEYLPDDKPVHALGLGGGPEGIFTAVARGMDTFDNTGITRMARSGLLFIHPEDGGNRSNKFRIDVKKSKYNLRKLPASKTCKCLSCMNYSAAYIHHLTISREPLAIRLNTIHNVFFINTLMNQIRKSIINNEFNILKNHWL
jgi:queuine tRNA-ribosyltransferase